VNELTPSSPASDDTVEFQLSNDDMQRLAQAAEAAQSQSAVPFSALVPPKPKGRIWSDVPPSGQQRRKTIVGWAGAVAVYAAFMVFAWWGVAAIPDQQTPAVTAAKAPKAPVHQIVTPPPAPAMVQVRNPFDATEVFEFPAGTSADESREKVAALLLKRASERRAQWTHLKPKSNLRMAKN
jgi:hypothetical protein